MIAEWCNKDRSTNPLADPDSDYAEVGIYGLWTKRTKNGKWRWGVDRWRGTKPPKLVTSGSATSEELARAASELAVVRMTGQVH